MTKSPSKDSKSQRLTRREFLGLGALGSTAVLAGCAPKIVPAALPADRPVRRRSSNEIAVACRRALGDASQIGDFLGAGGALDSVADKPDHLVTQAWRRLGMRSVAFEDISAEGQPWQRVAVSRHSGGAIKTDFTDWDRNTTNFRKNLGSTPLVYLGNVPRELSSHPELDNYSVFMPRDFKEWENFAASLVRHNIEAFGLRGQWYNGIPGEPDYAGQWLYNPGDNVKTQLRNSVELYAATYRGAKSADPTAMVGGPFTMNWQLTKYTSNEQTVFTLADWIRELARYLAQAGSNAAGLDYVGWQDYAWSSDRLSDGADAVTGFLAENGFDTNLPKGPCGGAGWGSWGSDYLDDSLKPHQRASYIAHNIIREFKDPRQRKIARTMYYVFFFQDDWIPNGASESERYEMETVRRPALVQLAADGSVRLTPLYAAFQMASAMTGGEIVETSAPEPLEAMATRDDSAATTSVIAAVNNHSGEEKTVDLTFWDVPFNAARVWRSIRRIDESNSGDGLGLQEPVSEQLSLENHRLTFPLSLGPYATVAVALRPA